MKRGERMNERYWLVEEMPDVVLDWVSANVVAAMVESWEVDKPVFVAHDKAGRMVVDVLGPGKPTDMDPSGNSDCYKVQCDLLDELTLYSEPYKDLGGPLSDSQREDMLSRANVLSEFALAVEVLAARCRGAGAHAKAQPAALSSDPLVVCDDLLSEVQVSTMLGVKPGTLSVWRSTKRYPLSYVKVGRHVKYRRSDVEEFIVKRTVDGSC